MAVYNYRLANGKNRWFFIIDLPSDVNGRRQHKRQGFPNQAAAQEAEEDARAAYGGADLGADGKRRCGEVGRVDRPNLINRRVGDR
ncbi:hypothetical protein OOJ91_00250 [Micromonospora lupini]|uniref:hypothetical protein n=1 Tax=Micromonospora lupini TaxID=285679 RepID=UPI00225B7A8F|nr:hypothetical protein [Micromonospora lupini]MCX5064293.1 hypothetical protein [Micromonospora lupini]